MHERRPDLINVFRDRLYSKLKSNCCQACQNRRRRGEIKWLRL